MFILTFIKFHLELLRFGPDYSLIFLIKIAAGCVVIVATDMAFTIDSLLNFSLSLTIPLRNVNNLLMPIDLNFTIRNISAVIPVQYLLPI